MYVNPWSLCKTQDFMYIFHRIYLILPANFYTIKKLNGALDSMLGYTPCKTK